MAIGLGSLITVLSATSPFQLPQTEEDVSSVAAQSSILNPSGLSQNAMNVAYSFTPTANLSLLSQPAASVLLAVQAESFASRTTTVPASAAAPGISSSSLAADISVAKAAPKPAAAPNFHANASAFSAIPIFGNGFAGKSQKFSISV